MGYENFDSLSLYLGKFYSAYLSHKSYEMKKWRKTFQIISFELSVSIQYKQLHVHLASHRFGEEV